MLTTSVPAAVALAAAPAVSSRPIMSAGPISEKIILDETSSAGPALWSLANGTPRTGSATYVSALAWTGTNVAGNLNVRTSTDGVHYDHKITLGETSSFRPAILAVSPAGPFLLAWTGTDPNHSLNLLYDVYGSRQKLTLDEWATGGPALATLGGKVFLAWTGTNPGHSLNILPFTLGASGQLTRGTKTILSQYSSDDGPALTADPHNNGQLLLTWTYRANDANAPLAINEAISTDGAHWTTPLVAPPPQTSIATPAILATNGSAVAPYYWSWSGTDTSHSLNLISTTSPQSWPAPVTTVNEQSDEAPALGYIGSGSSVLLAWTGTDPDHRLNIARFNLSSQSSAAAICQTAQLSASAAGSNAGAGNVGLQVRFTNASGQTCTLGGYPGALLLDANRAPMTTHVTQSTHGYLYSNVNPRIVTLAPGGSAYFVIEWTHNSPTGGACPFASYVEVTPPANINGLVVASQIDACGGNLIVSPVEPSSFGF